MVLKFKSQTSEALCVYGCCDIDFSENRKLDFGMTLDMSFFSWQILILSPIFSNAIWNIRKMGRCCHGDVWNLVWMAMSKKAMFMQVRFEMYFRA